ncbi:MAG: MFS transporter [Promethearchaeota archaeon]
MGQKNENLTIRSKGYFRYLLLILVFVLILACKGQSMINIAIWGSWVLISIITTELVPTNARGTGTGLKSLMGTIAGTTSLLVTSIITYYFSLFALFIIFLILLQIIIPVIYKFMIETKGVELRSSI